jgi:hypothetical protein
MGGVVDSEGTAIAAVPSPNRYVHRNLVFDGCYLCGARKGWWA